MHHFFMVFLRAARSCSYFCSQKLSMKSFPKGQCSLGDLCYCPGCNGWIHALCGHVLEDDEGEFAADTTKSTKRSQSWKGKHWPEETMKRSSKPLLHQNEVKLMTSTSYVAVNAKKNKKNIPWSLCT
jgi:hypothetical protein